MRSYVIISAQCVLIFSILYFHVKASDDDGTFDGRDFGLPVKAPFNLHKIDNIFEGIINDGNNEKEYGGSNWDKWCQLPLKSDFCGRFYKRYYFDVETKCCKPFTYGGCYGNENNFETLRECRQRCSHIRPNRNEEDIIRPKYCYLDADESICEAYHPMYYYNWKTKTCERFIYGGCGGNKNRFYSLVECQKVCKAEIKMNKRPFINYTDK